MDSNRSSPYDALTLLEEYYSQSVPDPRMSGADCFFFTTNPSYH